SVVQLERKAFGPRAVVAGALRQGRQARTPRAEGVAGDARRDDRHHPFARQFLPEQVQEARFHRLRRRHPAEDQQLSPQRRPARLTVSRTPGTAEDRMAVCTVVNTSPCGVLRTVLTMNTPAPNSQTRQPDAGFLIGLATGAVAGLWTALWLVPHVV